MKSDKKFDKTIRHICERYDIDLLAQQKREQELKNTEKIKTTAKKAHDIGHNSKRIQLNLICKDCNSVLKTTFTPDEIVLKCNKCGKNIEVSGDLTISYVFPL